MKIQAADETYMRVCGRTLIADGIRYMNWSGAYLEFEFTGRRVNAELLSRGFADCEDLQAWVGVYLDGSDEAYRRFKLEPDTRKEYILYESEQPEHHILRFVKMSEAAFAKLGVCEISVDCTAEGTPKPTDAPARRIAFIGDSITCGYGNEGIADVDVFKTSQENPVKAYSVQTARCLDADYILTSWSGIGILSAWVEETVNEPLNDWLMPKIYPYTDAAIQNDFGLPEIDWEVWDTSRFVPDVIVINLGTNDRSYTRFIPERTAAFRELYYRFLTVVRDKNPASEIVCTLGIMEDELCPVVRDAVEQFALDRQDTKISYMNLEKQDPADGMGADYHPSMITHQKMTEKLSAYIAGRMNWK